ncbi:phosphatase PAP2 family protein [uncultured Bradyrhizobium sp.]|uniref:phosphatase PAP2 family protein n=1 Tax=uncultured Bradyrhizobium sp. TaxID=199684 RepID=UPI002622AD97|nr:phosphatase PAP2 family protein [uncultured Bradyrhizobium sp.]
MPPEIDEQSLAQNLYLLNWIVLTTLALIVGVTLPFAGFFLAPDREAWEAVLLACLFVAAGHLLFTRFYAPRLAFVFASIAQLGTLSLLSALLTYIAAASNFPLQDAALDYCDRVIGLDWAAYYRFVTARSYLLDYAYLAYGAIAFPPLGVPIILGLTRNHVRLQRYVMAFLITLFIVSSVSIFIPALGTYYLYDLPTSFGPYKADGYLIQIGRLPAIRSGSLHALSISQIGGIVSFPSFHTAAAILALWAWWGVWWMRPFALLMCVATLMATPLMGGHYFIDIIAGAIVAVLAIVLPTAIRADRFFGRATGKADLAPSL